MHPVEGPGRVSIRGAFLYDGGERDRFGIAKGGSGTSKAGDGESVLCGDDFVVARGHPAA